MVEEQKLRNKNTGSAGYAKIITIKQIKVEILINGLELRRNVADFGYIERRGPDGDGLVEE